MPVLAAAIFLLTFALQAFHIASAYDVFLDETIYSRISAGAAINGKLVFGAYPFFLHGPLSFYWQAGLIRIFHISGTAVRVIDQLRLSNAAAGGVIALTLFSIVDRVASRRTAAVATGLFMLDPFINSYDSRLFIEPFASVWVALGYRAVLAAAISERNGTPHAVDGPQSSARVRRGRRIAAASRQVGRSPYFSGFLFGLALLTKETSAALYVLPLLWCVFRGWPVSRAFAARAIGAVVITYLPYPAIVAATGGTSQFVQQKFGGIERMLGLVQATGFNRPGAPSIVSRLTADLHTFLITYVIIGLGSIGVVYLLRKGGRAERVVAIWCAGAFVMMGFQIAQGTLEEQMFYYLVIPSIVIVGCATHRLIGQVTRHGLARSVIVASVVLLALFDVATYIEVRVGHDNGITDTVAWIDAHVPTGSRIAPLVDGIQYLLPGDRLLFNPEAGDVDARQLTRAGTEIAVTSSLQVVQRYSAATPQLITWLRRHARRIFSATGTTTGTVIVWQLTDHLPQDRPPGPRDLDPLAPISIGAPTYGHIDVESGD